MLIKFYLVDRSLKRLIEVQIDEQDTDFTIRQLMYQVLVQQMGVSKGWYMHYGLWAVREKTQFGHG